MIVRYMTSLVFVRILNELGAVNFPFGKIRVCGESGELFLVGESNTNMVSTFLKIQLLFRLFSGESSHINHPNLLRLCSHRLCWPTSLLATAWSMPLTRSYSPKDSKSTIRAAERQRYVLTSHEIGVGMTQGTRKDFCTELTANVFCRRMNILVILLKSKHLCRRIFFQFPTSVLPSTRCSSTEKETWLPGFLCDVERHFVDVDRLVRAL